MPATAVAAAPAPTPEPDPAPRPKRRFVAALVVVALLATLVPAIGIALAGPAAAAFSTTMVFNNGLDHVTVGPNSGIYIDGTLDYDDLCGGEGVTQDFLYPASDVYIVATGGVSGPLTDAGGSGPNTIVATATGLYIGEPIAFTSPGGSLGPGIYDVVFDTCQDGMFDGEDEIFFEAITVAEPVGDLPAPSEAIARIKAREQQQFEFWSSAHQTIALMFKVDKAKQVLECLLMPSPPCLTMLIATLYDRDNARAQLNNMVEDRVLGLIMNVAKNHGAIWQDPPDDDFEHLPALEPVERIDVPSGGAVPDAFTGLVDPLADETALSEALLHAIERYQGAQEAGDGEWALVHARAARDLTETLREQLETSTAVADLRAVVADPANAVMAEYEQGRQFVRRVQLGGFTGEERQRLLNAGLSVGDINGFEADIAGLGSLPVGDTGLVGQLDQVLAARAAVVSDLATSQADWDAVIAELSALTDTDLPAADAGGPYAGAAGAAVPLDAAGSTGATAFAWDLDGDGDFDDATGPTPDVVVAATGTGIVSVRATNDAGLASVDHAVLERTTDAPAPAITAASPAAAATVVVGTPTTFSLTATAPGSGALSYEWILDGAPVGSNAATFPYDPAEADTGTHTLAVDVTAANGRSATHAWRITVTTVDADGDGYTSVADCDDTRTDIHPGRFEMLGNGIDDDCDAGTPDAPPGGLTGAVWTWGHGYGLGTGNLNNSHTPAPLPAIPSAVQVESTHAGGVAVLPNGEVRTWASDGRLIGDGTQVGKYTPTSPLAVGGAPGSRLSGVVRVSSEHPGVVALRADGSVIAWGENRNGQVGDRSDVDTRLYPVEVVTADGTPVTGAIDVEQGENTNYILKADGTVWTVGVPHCHGGTSFVGTHYAIPAPLFGDDVVQIEVGDAWVVARKADGSLVACGSSLAELGRGSTSQTLQSMQTPKPMIGFGPGERDVVDISAGMSTGVALTEDGTVWMWGRNLNGEMNAAGVTQGHSRYVAIPVDLPPGPPVVAVDHDGSTTTIAIRADGSAVMWGGNYFGSMGTGSFSPNPWVGFHTLGINGTVIDGAMSTWNSLALVRPANDPTWDRPLQWLDVDAGDASIDEADGGTVPVTLSAAAPAGQDVEVSWSFAGQTGTATILAGQTQVDVPVAVDDDDIDEDDELLPFSIESVSNGVRVERGTSMVTVVDDDAAPVVSIGSTETDEGGTSLTDTVLDVTLSAPSSHDVVVTYSTHDGSAVAGEDYAAASGSLVVPAGQTAGELHVAVIGDLAMEPHEAFTVTLDDADHATIGEATGTVSIVDDEPIVLTMTSPTVTEGDTGTTAAVFGIAAAEVPAGTTVSVPYTIVPGTAENVTDVVAGSGTLALDVATPAATVEATVVADDAHEDLAIEVFRLVVGAATATDDRAVVPADPGVASILDDDPLDSAPVVSAGDDVSGPEGSPIAIAANVADDGPVTTTWSTDAAGCTIAAPGAAATTVTCVDDAVAQLTIAVDDGVHPTVSDTVTVTTTNVDPMITYHGYSGGALRATFTDAGADTHRCVVVFGDGTPLITVDPATSPCVVPHAYGPGSHEATITVVDDDGGEATATIPVQVQSQYQWDGFFQPIDNGVVNTVQAGRSIPVKFALGGYFGLDVLAEGSPASVPVACTTGSPTDAIEETVTAGATTLTYEDGRYHYVWKTNRAWVGQCRLLIVTLSDGSEHTATFRFR